MEFRDLKAQYKRLQPQMDEAMSRVIARADFISGQEVAQLEERLAAYVGARHCVSCANGTDALTLVLMAWGIGEGDAVFVPDFTFFSTGEAPFFLGAQPVFVDVDPETYNMDPESLKAAIEAVKKEGLLRPRVVIPVDLFGQPADYRAISHIAREYGLRVLEDAAQGFGGRFRNRRACGFGDAAITSFFPAKPLGCYGDGGAVFTDDEDLASLLRSLRVHGKGESKYENLRLGMNSRLDTLQAAVLLVKLDAFESFELEAVNHAAAEYSNRLKGAVGLPLVSEGNYSSWAQYTIRLKDNAERERVREGLRDAGIPSLIYYIRPMHCQPAFRGLGHYVPCGNTEKLCSTVLSLPMHPYLSKKDTERVCESLLALLDK